MNIFIDTESGVATDPYFANVSLLLHFDGTNGATTFTDSSSYSHTITRGADAALTTTSPKFGTACYVSTTGYASAPNHSAFDMGTGDFTVEGWANTATPTATRVLYSHDASGGNRVGPFVYTPGSGGIRGFCGGPTGGTLFGDTDGGSITPNAWFHWAYIRNGTSFKIFIDGTQAGTTATSSSACEGGQAVQIGRSLGAGLVWVGNIDEVRVTKGVARYTSNFSAPTAPFPNS